MATLTQISAAAQDADLIDRFISAAVEAGITNPDNFVATHRRDLAAAPVAAGSSDTIASVYAYAVASMPPPPGRDPAAVIDDYIRHAVSVVQGN